jgi:molybdopterin molybdotransferase
MLTPEKALEKVLQIVLPLGSELISHQHLLGRTLAQQIISPLDLPPFDNSAMDGFAVISADLTTKETSLELLETIGAGEVATQTVNSGKCLKIMTGAPVPIGADAVVMREETCEENGRIKFKATAKAQQNIRLKGSDVKSGQSVLETGSKIGAAQWAMLAGLGIAQAQVFQRPRIGVLTTGAELISVGTPLQVGQIYDSNSFALHGMIEATGAELVEVRRVDDSVEAVKRALLDLTSKCDLIVTSGGVSMGDFDPIRDVLHEISQVHFWKISMKPGKPVLFASLEGVPIFGLPGNPASVMVTFEEFVRPAILRLSGRKFLYRPTVQARLSHPIQRSAGRTEFMRAYIEWDDETANYVASVNGEQGSGRLSTMTNANALLVIPAESATLEKGSLVWARLITASENK